MANAARIVPMGDDEQKLQNRASADGTRSCGRLVGDRLAGGSVGWKARSSLQRIEGVFAGLRERFHRRLRQETCADDRL